MHTAQPFRCCWPHYTFTFINYGRKQLQDDFNVFIASVLLPHAEPSLLPHVYLAVFLLSTRRQGVFINAQSP